MGSLFGTHESHAWSVWILKMPIINHSSSMKGLLLLLEGSIKEGGPESLSDELSSTGGPSLYNVV